MSIIASHGYRPAPSIKQEKQAFCVSIPQLLADAESILKDPVRFHSLPGEFCYCSWPYLAGDGPLSLGVLVTGWKDGVLTDVCPDCGGTLYLLSFAGSPLSGGNSFTGYCSACRAEVRQNAAGHLFVSRLKFVLSLNQQETRLKYSTQR